MTDSTTFPVAHDTQLLALLQAHGAAWATEVEAERRLLQAAAKYRVNHTGEASWSENHAPRRCKLDELPLGTLYYQAKTFQRGDEGYWVTAEHKYDRNGETVTYRTRRAATVADAAYGTDVSDAALKAYGALVDARQLTALARLAVVEHEEAYTGWNRYFLVTSSTGHVHRSMSCHTCFATTTYAPVVSLSGKTDADAVELLGSTLCTVCFPDAPVEGKVRKLTKAQATKLLKGQA